MYTSHKFGKGLMRSWIKSCLTEHGDNIIYKAGNGEHKTMRGVKGATELSCFCCLVDKIINEEGEGFHGYVN